MMGNSFPFAFCMSARLANESLTAFCSELSLEGCLYSQQTWVTEIVAPFGAKKTMLVT